MTSKQGTYESLVDTALHMRNIASVARGAGKIYLDKSSGSRVDALRAEVARVCKVLHMDFDRSAWRDASSTGRAVGYARKARP